MLLIAHEHLDGSNGIYERVLPGRRGLRFSRTSCGVWFESVNTICRV